MQVLIDLPQSRARLLAQIGRPFGEIENVFYQRGKFISRRDAEKAHLSFGRDPGAQILECG